ncbi:MAG: RluA family pseudouridine synthase [Planctomycetota bacterium]|nr:RluA family pseudouridine synthase [Planctomycetota bacterium]
MATPRPNTITLTSRIPADARGVDLLTYLARRFRYHERDEWRRLLLEGRVQLDGTVATGDEPLSAGMELCYQKLHREPRVATNAVVLYEDEQLLVVDKPAHLPMHADGPFIRNTLIHLLRARHGDQLQLCHRLDRETSGVVIVAKDKQTQAAVQAQFGDGLAKEYVAVVHGTLKAPLVCDQPVGRHPSSSVRLRRSANYDATAPQAAHTSLTPIEHGAERTLVRCQPTTGRTHQIRAHLEHVGHPIVGDKLYGRGDADYLAFVRSMKAGESVFEYQLPGALGPNRHLLHAQSVTLEHPKLTSRMTFRAAQPPEFEEWLLR